MAALESVKVEVYDRYGHYQAGRIEEPNAEEILLRHMYGPATQTVGGYLAGSSEPLGLTCEEETALASALVGDLVGSSQESA